MAQQGGAIPKHFSLLTTIRFFASGFFLATVGRLGRLARDVDSFDAHTTLRTGGLSNEKVRLLRAGFALESTVAIAATIWAMLNVLAEATEQTRRSAIKGCWRVDFLVMLLSGTSVVLQKVGLNGSNCYGMGVRNGADFADDDTVMQYAHWCRRFQLAFRFTVVMIVMAVMTLYFTTRWMVNKRLSESRAVSDDWAKNRSARAQPYLALLQILAAPVRFIWRCCCKFGHSIKNPIAWTLIYSIAAVPMLIGLTIMALVKAFKIVKKSFCNAIGSKVQGTTNVQLGGDARGANGTEMSERAGMASVATKPVPAPVRAQSESSSTKRRKVDVSQHTAASPLVVFKHCLEPLKRSPKATTTVPSFLHRLLEHPNLFFETLSHLHGADVRALSSVSKTIRSTVMAHRSDRPHAMRRYICSRAPVNGLSSVLDAPHIPSCPVQASTTTSSAPLSDTIRRLFGLSENATDHSSHPCWSCGIIICPSCSLAKPNLRLSKAELRLHSLEPVCSLCYFKALCGPYARQPQRRWPGSTISQRRANTCRVFHSLSAKCACTMKTPPRLEHALCRDCHPLKVSEMWRKRIKRGATTEAEELPASTSAIMQDGTDLSDFDEVSTDDDDDDDDGGSNTVDPDVEATAGSAGPTLSSRSDFDPGGFQKPTLATSIHHCYACHQRLWILPSWLGFGKTRGLRWWRCRRCGLEARNVMMSLRREFL